MRKIVKTKSLHQLFNEDICTGICRGAFLPAECSPVGVESQYRVYFILLAALFATLLLGLTI